MGYNRDKKIIKEETAPLWNEKYLKYKATKALKTYKMYKNLFEKIKKGLKSFTNQVPEMWKTIK